MKLHALLATVTLCAAGIQSTLACCALGRAGEPVVNADQTVLLIWDPRTKTEHLIRKASFKAEGDDFGFLVPTPSRPQLSESGNEVFPRLAEITRPRSKPSLGIGCSAASNTYGIAPGDLYVAPARTQAPVLRWADARPTHDASLGLCLAWAGLVWLRKNTPPRQEKADRAQRSSTTCFFSCLRHCARALKLLF